MIVRPVSTSISLLIFSTRFEVQGVNDDGHVANFVETEQLVRIDKTNNRRRSDASKSGVFGSLLLKLCSNPGLCSIILGAAWDKCGFTQNQNGKVCVFQFQLTCPTPLLKHFFNEQMRWNLAGDLSSQLLLSTPTLNNWKLTMEARWAPQNKISWVL